MSSKVIKPFLSHGDPENAEPLGYSFRCPGCKSMHTIYTREVNSLGAIWAFNGDMEKPTFTPSIGANMNDPKHRCHSFVTDGNIQFLNDCYHELAGKTVPMLPQEEET